MDIKEQFVKQLNKHVEENDLEINGLTFVLEPSPQSILHYFKDGYDVISINPYWNEQFEDRDNDYIDFIYSFGYPDREEFKMTEAVFTPSGNFEQDLQEYVKIVSENLPKILN
jgi:hypothetical protein